MLISTKGRYALRIMIDLAEHQAEGYIPLRKTAERQGISEKYLEAILKILVKNKFLEGLRGKGGGYKLVKPPEAYTVGSILQTVELSIAPVPCLDPCKEECSRKSSCRTLPLWQGLDHVIRDYLEHITLADLMERES
ncbi:MAG: Rrf2 family transcriptional regulator [Hungatella sp.]|jgi:Rrf2 family protein|nr:Rrf2 family transcriptional regulator [Hungatella sp.]